VQVGGDELFGRASGQRFLRGKSVAASDRRCAGGKIKLKTTGKNSRKKNDGRAYIDFRRGEDSRAHATPPDD